MPKILHLADIHIGMENYGRIDPATGLHTRLLDFLARLDEAITHALEIDPVDLVIIAGDIYKTRTPNPTHQREFAKRMLRLIQARLPIVILTGNHDLPGGSGRAHSVEIFGTLAIEGVTIADRLAVHLIPTRNGPVQIVAIPWLSAQMLLTKDDSQGLPMIALESEMIRRVEHWLDAQLPTLDPGIPTVLTFHGSISGATYGGERSLMLGRDLVLPRSVIARPPVDYVALGHIHKHQVVGEAPPAVYPGSLERIDFGEEHEAKGFVIVDLAPGRADWRFVPVAARPFHTIEVDVTEVADPQARVLTAIRKRDLADAVVRLQVQCTPAQRPHLDDKALRAALEEGGAAFVASLVIEAARSTRTRYAAIADELRTGITPRRALELYLQSRNIAAARQVQLLDAFDHMAQQGND